MPVDDVRGDGAVSIAVGVRDPFCVGGAVGSASEDRDARACLEVCCGKQAFAPIWGGFYLKVGPGECAVLVKMGLKDAVYLGGLCTCRRDDWSLVFVGVGIVRRMRSCECGGG